MLSASVASQIVFISTLKKMAGGSVLIGVKEGEMKMTQIVYVQLGSFFFAIWAKMSSDGTSLCTEHDYSTLPEKIPYGRLRIFRCGKKLQGFINFSYHHKHRWLSPTARSLASTGGGGAVWLVRSSLHTTEFFTFRIWQHVKNCTYRRNGITKNVCDFETMTFPKRGIPGNRLSSHAYCC